MTVTAARNDEVPTTAEDAGVERRRPGARYRTVLRIGKLILADGEELCLVRNLSSGGLMAHVYSPHVAGERLAIELRGGQPLAGTVRWTKDGRIGVEFDSAVDPAALLSAEQVEPGERPRAPRVAAVRTATLHRGDTAIPAVTCDLSQGGAKLECRTPVAVGEVATVQIAGFEPKRCVVRWAHGTTAGVEFYQPIDLGGFMAGLRAGMTPRD